MFISAKVKIVLWLAAGNAILFFPFEVLHALLNFLHYGYELIEYLLDGIIHRLFHTDRATTQIIVFYLMLAMIAYASYVLLRYLTSRCKQWQQDARERLARAWYNVMLWRKDFWSLAFRRGRR